MRDTEIILQLLQGRKPWEFTGTTRKIAQSYYSKLARLKQKNNYLSQQIVFGGFRICPICKENADAFHLMSNGHYENLINYLLNKKKEVNYEH